LDVAKILIKNGAYIHAKDKSGEMPLHNIALFGDYKVLKLLVESGSGVNALEGNHWFTPLHYAAQSSKVENVEVLLKMGANINARDKKGRTPLQLAEYYQRTGTVANLDYSGVIKILKRYRRKKR
jgi:ankyrin repeat protein